MVSFKADVGWVVRLSLGLKLGLASGTRWTGWAVEGEERKAVIEVS